jgi:hypothetical protein
MTARCGGGHAAQSARIQRKTTIILGHRNEIRRSGYPICGAAIAEAHIRA